MNSAALNQIAQLLGTTDKNVVYNTVLKMFIDAGMAVDVAFDELFGAGAYVKFAGQVFDALQAA